MGRISKEKHIRKPYTEKELKRIRSIDNTPSTTIAIPPPRNINLNAIVTYMVRLGYNELKIKKFLIRLFEFANSRIKDGDQIDAEFVVFQAAVDVDIHAPIPYQNGTDIAVTATARPPRRITKLELARYMDGHGYGAVHSKEIIEIVFEFCRNRLVQGDVVDWDFVGMQMIPQFTPHAKRIRYKAEFKIEPAKEDYHKFPQTSPREAQKMYENYIALHGMPEMEYDKWIAELGYRQIKDVPMPSTTLFGRDKYKAKRTTAPTSNRTKKIQGSWVMTVNNAGKIEKYVTAIPETIERTWGMLIKWLEYNGYAPISKSDNVVKYSKDQSIVTANKEFITVYGLEGVNHPIDFDVLKARGCKTLNDFIGKTHGITENMDSGD